jgi:protein SCO1
MMKNRILTSILLIALILNGIPLSTWACSAHNKFSSKAARLPGNSIYHLRGQWTNQENKKISFQSLSGRLRIIAMVYTKCPSSCPMIVQDIKLAMSQIPSEFRQGLHVDLFSFDSENETAESLQNFRAKFKMTDNWSAYSGSQSAVSELAAVLGLQFKKQPSGEFIHANVIYLVNGKGEVLAKQEGLKASNADFQKQVAQSYRSQGDAG